MNNLSAISGVELVPVFTGTIGGRQVQMCDARALHTYLEVGKVFASWFAERVEKFGFEENQDFIFASQNGEAKNEGRGGHNRKDYHLTLNMAKELGMLENNDKGRSIRKYFIEMEQRAVAPRYPVLTQYPAAQEVLRNCLDVFQLLGVPVHLAQIESVKHVKASTGVDLAPVLRLAPAQDNIPNSEVMLEPTALGRKYGLSGREVNQKLMVAGLQYRDGDEWLPTKLADGLCARHAWNKQGKSGYNIKWSLEKIRDILCDA
jgi:phage anti-repressor protein